MSNYDASNLDCDYVQCAVCERVITGGKWFARIKHGEWKVALCCPLCSDTFQRSPHACVRRIETLKFMRSQNGSSQQDSPLNG